VFDVVFFFILSEKKMQQVNSAEEKRQELRKRLRQKCRRNPAPAIKPSDIEGMLLASGVNDMSILKMSGSRGKAEHVLQNLKSTLSQLSKSEGPSGGNIVVDTSDDEENVPDPPRHLKSRHASAVQVDDGNVVDRNEYETSSDLNGSECLGSVEVVEQIGNSQ